MKYIQENDKVIMTGFNSFNIKEILECGQCFRFNEIEPNFYKIVAYGKVLYIVQSAGKVEFYPTNLHEFKNIWSDYFDLETDYMEIKKVLSVDPILKDAIIFADGIRILNQEPWECLISFIISQNNRIPMIKQVIKNISEKYGTEVDGEFLFPTLEQLKGASNDELMLCKTGFRSKYILDAIDKISSNEVNLSNLIKMPLEQAKEKLLTIKGVGTKVADCTLLFSLKKNEVFPTDVWVKRVMEHFYFNEQDTNIKVIHSFAKEKWGDFSGYAQQYLFYYARSNKIGVN